ncbi:hypothetical protein [Bifidobacterium dentium]|nr:hypothetical protein [Bifidobacterium dentium]
MISKEKNMFDKIKKPVVAALLTVTVLFGGAGMAFADTVYYQGVAVSWDHGRTAGVFSYSNVQTSRFSHLATANTVSSGWQEPGVPAKALAFVGTGQATAFWDCRG